MYCISFPRRSPVGVDNDRKTSNDRTDLLQKVKSDLADCGINGGRRDHSVPIITCARDQERQSHDLAEEKAYVFNQQGFTSPATEYLTERTRRLTTIERKQREQGLERPNSLNSLSRASPKAYSSKMKAAGFQKHNEKWEYEGPRRRQRSEQVEQKHEDFFDFVSFRELEQVDPSGWPDPLLSSGDAREPSFSKDPFVHNKRKDDSSNESQSTMSDRRLRNELKNCRRMLELEKNKNRSLQCRLQNMECKLKVIEGSQSTREISGETKRLAEQTHRLEEHVAFYRRQYQEEKKKTYDLEDNLRQSQLEKQTYAEQMDVLIFEYIPKAAPKFNDIGPVDHEINESFDSVGVYQLGETIGEGYYGSVRIGFHAKTRQRFAVKVLNKTNINRFKDLKQIAGEIHVLKTYRHPNIIHLEEVLHTSENIYMVSELCYMDLHKYHSQIGLTSDSARQVVYGILQPLYHLHLHGICHLDLKPENILLTNALDSHNASHTHVRICDFGLVSMAKKSGKNKDVVREGYSCGTPGFFAPEMILQDKFEGRIADMWSLGCIILEITLGFTQEWLDCYDRADNNPSKFKKVLETCLKEINIHLYPKHVLLLDIIHNCLSIDPSKRISSELAISHPWLKQT